MIDAFAKMLRPLQRRMHLMIARAVVKAVVDTGNLQRIQVVAFEDEVHDKLERIGTYGFTSHCPKGSDAIVFFPGGDRTHGFIVGTEFRAKRMKNLLEGETAQWTDEEDFLALRRGRKFEGRANKWKFQGENDELMDLFIKVADQLERVSGKLKTTTTNTIFGPMKLFDWEFFGERESDVAELKEKIEGLAWP